MTIDTAAPRTIGDGERLVGTNVYLRLLEMSDCGERYLTWLRDPEVNRFLETRFVEQTDATIQDFVMEMRKGPDNYLFGIVLIETDRHIGNIKVGGVNHIHKHCEVGYFIGDRDMWGKGIATEAIRLATQFGFERLGLHRCAAVVDVDNPASAKALERVGYKREGTMREKLFMDGRWSDQYLYGLLRDEFRHPATPAST
jgi:RimJ/RimL family protein N-acetyltransferase